MRRMIAFLIICMRMSTFRLDNYIALGDNILEFVKEKSKQKYGFYKIFNRDGFLNIIPQEATEEQIEQYLQGLKSDSL